MTRAACTPWLETGCWHLGMNDFVWLILETAGLDESLPRLESRPFGEISEQVLIHLGHRSAPSRRHSRVIRGRGRARRNGLFALRGAIRARRDPGRNRFAGNGIWLEAEFHGSQRYTLDSRAGMAWARHQPIGRVASSSCFFGHDSAPRRGASCGKRRHSPGCQLVSASRCFKYIRGILK